MDALINAIEAELPDLRWLLRKTREGEERGRLGGVYYAHICNDDHSESYEAGAEYPETALRRAFDVAKRVRAA